MGLLDNNIVRTTPYSDLDKSENFKKICSNDDFDAFIWDSGSYVKSQLSVTFRDYFAWFGGDANVYIKQGNITDEPIVVPINNTNFPGLRKKSNNHWPYVQRIIACPCDIRYGSNGDTFASTVRSGRNTRLVVIFENGQVYHNYPSCNDNYDYYSGEWDKEDVATRQPVSSYFSKFAESVVWDLPSRKTPVKTTTGDDSTLIATGKYYYNPALPSQSYEMHPALNTDNGYGFGGWGATIGSGANIRPRFWRPDVDNVNANSFFYMGGYVADNQFTMVCTYNSNKDNNPCRMCVFGTNDGGKSWYVMYEFGGKEALKYNSELRASNTDWKQYGIALAQEGSASSNLYTIKRRACICPTSENKEPSNKFEFGQSYAIASIVGTASEITVTTSAATDFNEGECVLIDFADGVSASGRTFDWMVNASATQNDGGNGILFKVKDVSNDKTSFKLTQSIHNPDNNLQIAHIHCANRCKDGVSIGCGEQYPYGGWILYGAIKLADTYAGYDVSNPTQTNWVRLNSTNKSAQRPLGFIIQEEYENDSPINMCYFASDNEYTTMDDVVMPEGRTNTFKHNSVGVYKFKLPEIDDLSANGDCVLHTREVAYGMQKLDNAYIFVGQFGLLAVSYDDCKTWSICHIPQSIGLLRNYSGTTYDRMLSVNNLIVQLKK